MAFYDGTNLHVVVSESDLTGYLALDGDTMASDAVISFIPSASGNEIINGWGGVGTGYGLLESVMIDGGTY